MPDEGSAFSGLDEEGREDAELPAVLSLLETAAASWSKEFTSVCILSLSISAGAPPMLLAIERGFPLFPLAGELRAAIFDAGFLLV